jgi:hypothetical protein
LPPWAPRRGRRAARALPPPPPPRQRRHDPSARRRLRSARPPTYQRPAATRRAIARRRTGRRVDPSPAARCEELTAAAAAAAGGEGLGESGAAPTAAAVVMVVVMAAAGLSLRAGSALRFRASALRTARPLTVTCPTRHSCFSRAREAAPRRRPHCARVEEGGRVEEALAAVVGCRSATASARPALHGAGEFEKQLAPWRAPTRFRSPRVVTNQYTTAALAGPSRGERIAAVWATPKRRTGPHKRIRHGVPAAGAHAAAAE